MLWREWVASYCVVFIAKAIIDKIRAMGWNEGSTAALYLSRLLIVSALQPARLTGCERPAQGSCQLLPFLSGG
jgi:hypothetical protein